MIRVADIDGMSLSLLKRLKSFFLGDSSSFIIVDKPVQQCSASAVITPNMNLFVDSVFRPLGLRVNLQARSDNNFIWTKTPDSVKTLIGRWDYN